MLYFHRLASVISAQLPSINAQQPTNVQQSTEPRPFLPPPQFQGFGSTGLNFNYSNQFPWPFSPNNTPQKTLNLPDQISQQQREARAELLAQELTEGFKSLPLLLHNVLAIKCINIRILPGFAYTGGIKVLVDRYYGSQTCRRMTSSHLDNAFTIEATCSITGNILGIMYVENGRGHDGAPYVALLLSAREHYNQSYCSAFPAECPEERIQLDPWELSFGITSKPHAKTDYASGTGTILLYLLSNITKHVLKKEGYGLSTFRHFDNNAYYSNLGLSGPSGLCNNFSAQQLPCPNFDKVLRYITPEGCNIPNVEHLLATQSYLTIPELVEYRRSIAITRRLRQNTPLSRFIPR